MIILKDIELYDKELQRLLERAVSAIHQKSSNDHSIQKLSGTLFEKVVCDTLNEISINTDFYRKFEQSTAHAFPDIYAKIIENKWFGIEVKTSQNDWKCFGNSIFESTKSEYLEDRIYIFFGKFANNTLECKWAKYEECIDNINITHSPRYQINMDIKAGEKSVFAKMKVPYLIFSNSDATQRMDYVRKFKRDGLGPNAALWWLPSNDDLNNNEEDKLVIKLLKDVPYAKRQEIILSAVAFFPQLFSTDHRNKYAQVMIWLASQFGVVTGSLRDSFSAGGKFEVTYNGDSFKLPKVCSFLNDGIQQIKSAIYTATNEDLIYRWQLSNDFIFKDNKHKLSIWISKVSENLGKQNLPTGFSIQEWLNSLYMY